MSNAPDGAGPDYDLVCPSCNCRCVGKTCVRGGRGTYRDLYLDYYVRQIACSHCGFIKEWSHAASQKQRYWFRIKVGDDVLWAENETRLRYIRAVLAGDLDRNEAGLYALPKWLLRKKNRNTAIVQIDKMLADPAFREIADGRSEDQVHRRRTKGST